MTTVRRLRHLSHHGSGTLTRTLSGFIAAICLLVVSTGWGAPVAHAQGGLLLDSGHVDAFSVSADANGLYLDLKEDVTGQHVRHDPESVTLGVKQEAYRDNIPGLDMPGYLLPLTEQSGLLWPGWDTTAVAAAGLGHIDITFNDVSGPGRVFLFTQEGLGGGLAPLLNTGLEVVSGSSIPQQYPAHTHAYWVFEQPGTYTMNVSASSPDTGQSSEAHTYTWQVGDGSGTVPSTGGSGSQSGDSAASAGGAQGAGPQDSSAQGSSAGKGATPGGAGGAGAAAAGKAAPAKAGAPAGAAKGGAQSLANTGLDGVTAAVIVLAVGLLLLGGAMVYAVRR
ncbi:choice-of-anchor M domain-containing protein [Corynebacterium falsenii]|uniref:choice-of-anchor M domain-containing protein n=1 Tax=Corynebacterium falsenii TaxID=108486 RepID=UPI003FD116FE